MTAMSKTERAALCDLALQVGEDQPTLCGDWTVKDLVVHLLVREGNPAAIGISAQRLAGLTELASRRVARDDFAVLVERVRSGPPFYSPFRIGKIDALANTIEFFVHHEDIRRAQPGWEPRTLAPRQENLLWKQLKFAGKGLVRGARVGVVLQRSDDADRAVLSQQDRTVVVRGLPSELTLYSYGRKKQAHVELEGSSDDVAALQGADLGF